MNKLDKLDLFEKLDVSKMRDSISDLSKQVGHAWQDTRKINVPEDYDKINKIVVSGMGGSALGADITRHVFSTQLKHPLWIVNIMTCQNLLMKDPGYSFFLFWNY